MSITPSWLTISRNLSYLTAEIRDAEKEKKVNLPKVVSKDNFLKSVRSVTSLLPPSYADDFWRPARKYLKKFTEEEFQLLNLSNKQRKKDLKKKGPQKPEYLDELEEAHDIVQAILQRDQSFKENGRCALQQMTCDLWNTFVKSSGLCPNGHCLSPIVKFWEGGLYALHHHSVRRVHPEKGKPVAIISVPPGYAHKGALGWTVLGHEVAHTILEIDRQPLKLLHKAVEKELSKFSSTLRRRWLKSWKISEIGADVMNVLYLGPAGAVGLIASLRAENSKLKLSSEDDPTDEHPADVLRGLLVAYVVSELDIREEVRRNWQKYLCWEVERDFDPGKLKISWGDAKNSAKKVARVVMHERIIDGGKKYIKHIEGIWYSKRKLKAQKRLHPKKEMVSLG